MHVLTNIFHPLFKRLSILHFMTPTHEYNLHLYENCFQYLKLEKREKIYSVKCLEFLQVARLGNDTFNINIAVYQSIALSIKRGCKITKEQPQHIFMYFVKQTN